jgi:hypothetical protein
MHRHFYIGLAVGVVAGIYVVPRLKTALAGASGGSKAKGS